LMFARAGAVVTAIDASEEMLDVARQRAAEQQLQMSLLRGDAHELRFLDRSFDVAVSLRVLMHAPDWVRCLGELCRVADRLVIFDYPSASSLALLESIARRLKAAAGMRTEAYRVFTDRRTQRVLQRAGFRVRSVHRQFVLPIRLHRLIGSRRFTERSERLLERVGLLRLVGSPVTVCAERCGS
jgi:ubiquinone/menaquinone biosynthesis C-methylase UbiE